ncbi:ATP-binding protein [Streptomyces sp. NPDC059629]|uniref:ATP-binding protein n=1 Tax=Streptomyces sp. NPDC059629 TaxID=3346889 RepID=UPI00367CEF0F
MARSDPERPTNGFTVAADIDAVPSARRRVVALALNSGVPLQAETLENVELLACEVITNAVLHSAGPCNVVVIRTAERLRVEVTDSDPKLPRTAVAAGPGDESGRGLLLVDALADAWGMQPDSESKTTWFEVKLGSGLEGLGGNSTEDPLSSRAVAVRRVDRQDRPTRPVESRASSVPANVREQHRAA